MAKYGITTYEPSFEVHDASGNLVEPEAEGYVELSDKEVNDLVELIRKSGTTDVKQLDLENKLPEVYNKLNNACREIVILDEERSALVSGVEDELFDFDHDELMKYCEEEYGYSDGDDYEDFYSWLVDCIDSMDAKECRDFIINHMNGHVDIDVSCLEYDVVIPKEIIEKSNGICI